MIVRRSVEAENADWKAHPGYSFTQMEREDGGPANTYEVTMLLGTRYRRLIAIDGRPVSRDEQAAEEKKLQTEIRKRRAETPEERGKRIEKANKDREQEHAMILQMADAFVFRVTGEETIGGYRAWALDATPKAGYQPPNQRAKVLTGMRGKLWVAQDGYHWLKVQAEVVEPVYFEGFLARVGPGTRIDLEKAPAPNGTWQWKYLSIKVEARILGVFSHNWREEDTFWNYRPSDSGQAPTVATR